MKLVVPEEILAQHVAVLGKTGSGKSSAMRYLVEHLLDEEKPVCIVDPKGDWWGIKSSADGKAAGYEVVIFGGEHADVPIDARAGGAVAELVATGNRPAIVDLGGWTVEARTQFFIDFAETIFRTTRGHRWLVIDEVHNFAPKGKIFSPESGMMLHWANRLASEGRGKGINLVVASQRPQKVHNDLLTSCETLISMRLIHPRDRDAVAEWLDGAGDKAKAAEILATLAQMPRGEAWVWSPEIGFGPERVSFPMFKTFDSFAASANSGQVKLKGWASVNLDEVKEKLAATIEKAKADDPKELRRQIADLHRQLKAAPSPAPVPPAEIKVPVVTDEQLGRINELVDAVDRQVTVTENVVELLKAVRGEAVALRGEVVARSRPQAYAAKRLPVVAPPAPARATSAKAPANPTVSGIGSREQRFLDAAASLQALGSECTRETVATWVGVHPRGGSVGEVLGALASQGLIVNDRGRVTVTDDGLKYANNVDPASAIEQAKSGLSNRQRKFFELIEGAGGDGITREQIADAVGIHPRGGSLGEDLGRLVGRGLVTGERGHYRLRDFLMGV